MVARTWSAFSSFIEAVSNYGFYLLALLFVVLPGLVWLSDMFKNRSSALWVSLSIVVFVFILPPALELFARASSGLIERMRKGQLFAIALAPIHNLNALIGIYGVFKLEYVLVHGMPEAKDTSWTAVIWGFISGF